MGLVALRHVGSFQNRNQTYNPELASRLLTTGPPEKSLWECFFFFLAVFLTSSPGDFDACQSLRTMSLRNYVGMDQGDWWGGREEVVVPARGEEAENICKGRWHCTTVPFASSAWRQAETLAPEFTLGQIGDYTTIFRHGLSLQIMLLQNSSCTVFRTDKISKGCASRHCFNSLHFRPDPWQVQLTS